MVPPLQPILYFWTGRALYFGPVRDNAVHQHHAVQIVLGPTGNFEIGIGNKIHQVRAAVVDTDQPHRLDAGQTAVAVFLVEPESEAAGRLRQGCLNGASYLLPDLEPLKLFPDEFHALSAEGSCPKAGELFDEVIQDLSGTDPPPRETDPRVEKALTQIEALPEKRITVAELAAGVYLSESRFIHVFTARVGIPPRRYLLWKRLRQAQETVFAGKNLTEAAHAAGFADSAHFSRTFKEMFGLSPSSLFQSRAEGGRVRVVLCG